MGTVHYWLKADDEITAEAGPGFPRTVAVTIKAGVLGMVVEDAAVARHLAAAFAQAADILTAAGSKDAA